jgi:hypothetical protein
VEVWFEDECRFGQKGTLTRVWAERGSRPLAPKQGGFKSLHVLTAVCPATGAAEGLVSERLDSAVAQVFLDQLSRALAPGSHAVLVWDNAGYHVAGCLRVPANVTVVQLPSYSPELNPVERLWGYLGGRHWANRAYAGLAEVERAAVAGWRATCLDADRVKRICACGYLPAGS